MSGLHFHALTVRDLRPAASDAVQLSLAVPPALADAFRFDAGQYLTVRHGELRRSYSICSAPGEGLSIGVRRVPGGAFSGCVLSRLQAGDTIDVMEPQGRFGAALGRRPRHLLAIAGGSGITPILPILKTALGKGSRCTLLYGNRSAASTMFKAEIDDLKDRYLARLAVHTVFSRETVDTPLNGGRIDAGKIASLLRLSFAPIDQAFVCGPFAMNDEVESALRSAGVAPEAIHIERFGVPPSAADARLHAPQAGDATTARITIVRDGITREIGFEPGDESILAAASRAGFDVPYSCRSGVCATCRAKLVEGRVRMDRNFALEQSDLDAGFVLTCQSHPLTDRVVVSFDQR